MNENCLAPEPSLFCADFMPDVPPPDNSPRYFESDDCVSERGGPPL